VKCTESEKRLFVELYFLFTVHYGNRNYSSTNNCTIKINCHSMVPYICFGHYMTIIWSIYIYIYMYALHCALSTFVV
jgi:regulator of sigma D